MPRWQSRLAAILGLLTLGAAASNCEAVTPPAHKRVLILHSFGQQFEPFRTVASSFKTELSLRSPYPIEYYDISLETARFTEGDFDQPLAGYLDSLCTGRPMDLVACIGSPAFRFAIRQQAQLFQHIPILAAGIEQRHLNGMSLGSNATAITFTLDHVRFFEDILLLFPETKHVVVVFGTSPLERFWGQEMRREWQPFEGRVTFTWLNDLSLAEMRSRLAALPPRSVVVFGFIGVDGTGVPYEQATALDTLAAAANSPMFGLYDTELGHGIVGGRMIEVRRLGISSAGVAIRLLHGEPGESIPIVPALPGKPTFDAEVLRRWGIRTTQLPAGSELQFTRPSLWKAYRWQLIGLAALVGLEALLILLLMKNRERLRAIKAELLKNEENIALASRSARLGFWTLDMDHDFLWVTDEGRDLFGWSRNESVGFDRFLETLRPQDREPAKRALRRVLENGGEFEAEHRIVLADGNERWITTRGRAQTNGDGRQALIRGVSLDVTSSKKAVHEAQELRRELSHTGRLSLLSQFTTSLAHELGQPLGAIQRNAEAAELFLNASPPDLEEIRGILSDVRKDCERAGMVIDRLRAMLRRRGIEVQSLVWNELAHEAAGLVRAESHSRGISLEIETPLGLPHLKGDRVHIEQVLINLVANAMDAIDSHPNGERRVTISARAGANGTVECSVKDTGPGIPAECMAGIFDPFVTTKQNGMGMGLPICQTLIETMGGRLWVETNSGKGATFRFTVPVGES